jgi:hypothetical protein
MESTFSERIHAEIRRGVIDSPAVEEVIQLESWMMQGAPTPETPAGRLRVTQLEEK